MTTNLSPKKILLVDDDRLFLRVLTQYLDEAQYDYISCENGQQAWSYLQKYPDKFFVVLADRVMPKLHGIDLLVKMKKNSLDIPFVLLTGEASKEEMCAAIAQGVYDFIYKPISKELLLAILKKIKKQLI
ncbi:MAG: Regulatory protein AtoC [Pseudomonadota bacterium]